jgi:LemA protein
VPRSADNRANLTDLAGGYPREVDDPYPDIVSGVVILVVLVVILGALLFYGVATFNKLIRQRNQVESSWAQIDVQLRRRHDLIPNLVETVKGYAAHERQTLEAVIAARQGAVDAQQSGAAPGQIAEKENALTRTLGRLFALAEAYPDLKANQNFLQLQSELVSTEDKIAYARQFFNTAVQTLNTSVESVPSNVVAGIAGIKRREYFEAADDERGPVGVRF